MDFKVQLIKRAKTIKAIKKHRLNKGHVPLPKRIWESIYTELGTIPDDGMFFQILSNCDVGLVYVISQPGRYGPLTADHIVGLPVEVVAKFPGGLQEIIFSARESGEYNRTVTFNVGEIDAEGQVSLDVFGRKEFKKKD